jgi:hypothetical protein
MEGKIHINEDLGLALYPFFWAIIVLVQARH